MKLLSAVFCLAGAGICQAQFHTNTITTPGGAFNFTVDGVANNPTIELQAGVTNILNIQTSSFHPVVVTTAPIVSDEFSGATPQNVNAQPMALVTPEVGFPATLYYMCSIHQFYGQINLVAPPSPVPPQNTILMVQVRTNVVMTSTGTNTTWALIPEFSSNLVEAVWAPVPNFTNTFANGTNTTVFDRLDPICGPNVFLRVRQQKP